MFTKGPVGLARASVRATDFVEAEAEVEKNCPYMSMKMIDFIYLYTVNCTNANDMIVRIANSAIIICLEHFLTNTKILQIEHCPC